ncbi:FdtA/QdtA family cupin domain-containing protein [Flavobacteriales bacterium]|nr:FdtA/QdtA family cupin domain-containing protein [Flavobacteriales bacterium]
MKKIQLQKHNDVRGNLTFFQNNDQIPFKIERTYWIYDVSGGETREGHAFKESEEFIIALSGSFDIEITKQGVNKTFKLSRPFYGIYIPKLTWRNLTNFSTNTVALIVASTKYDKEDYLRDYKTFKKLDS